MTAIRVLHVPGRTPYARKLRDPLYRLTTVLAECRRAGKRVVFTAHDLTPIFEDRATHHRRLRVLAEHDLPFVCLTAAAEAEARWRFGARTSLIPHGYVAEPGITARPVPRKPGPTRFLVYGSLRPNRDMELLLHCWRFARHLRETNLHLLLRAPSQASLAEEGDVWRAIREHAVDPRLAVDALPLPSDDEVNEAVADADCLVLPYRWASHSGQLEIAFDVGVLPVVTRTGFLPDQAAVHRGLINEPVWFDWLTARSSSTAHSFSPLCTRRTRQSRLVGRRAISAGSLHIDGVSTPPSWPLTARCMQVVRKPVADDAAPSASVVGRESPLSAVRWRGPGERGQPGTGLGRVRSVARRVVRKPHASGST